jgi:hypothetical protein
MFFPRIRTAVRLRRWVLLFECRVNSQLRQTLPHVFRADLYPRNAQCEPSSATEPVTRTCALHDFGTAQPTLVYFQSSQIVLPCRTRLVVRTLLKFRHPGAQNETNLQHQTECDTFQSSTLCRIVLSSVCSPSADVFKGFSSPHLM